MTSLADTMTLRDLYKKSHFICQTRKLARRAVELGDDGTNDLLVSEVLRTNELQVWFLSEHLVDVPLIRAKSASQGSA